MMTGPPPKPWIVRDYIKCSGCRLCEIACSITHEGRIWPEASRIRVFMLVPGVEVPHLCAQCSTYPCIEACPVNALSTHKETGAVIVDNEKCTACGLCIDACPGTIPHLHPNQQHIVICDLCGGDPECAKICEQAGYFALFKGIRTQRGVKNYDLYAKNPEEITANLVVNLYGEKGEEFIE
jgi:Fe-S-cluster-containing hydrogenase component 2